MFVTAGLTVSAVDPDAASKFASPAKSAVMA